MPKITATVQKGIGQQTTPEPGRRFSVLDRKRVAAYCRVSTLEEDQDLSYEAQQKYYKALFEQDPQHILIGVYGDEGISGRLARKRPGFLDMVRDCKHGRIDEIYTKSISRFARNYAECIEYVRELKHLGIVIYFEKENFHTNDPNIEMLLSIMAIMAQEESNSISQNITLAQEYRNKKGDPIRRAPYGYTRDKQATDGIHQWHIHEAEAERVRMVYALFLQGYQRAALARKLNDYEKKHGGTKKWTSAVVTRMLSNEVYVGDLITAKSYTVDYLHNIRKRNDGEKEQQYLKDHHPAIISRADFTNAQELLGRSLPVCMEP